MLSTYTEVNNYEHWIHIQKMTCILCVCVLFCFVYLFVCLFSLSSIGDCWWRIQGGQNPFSALEFGLFFFFFKTILETTKTKLSTVACSHNLLSFSRVVLCKIIHYGHYYMECSELLDFTALMNMQSMGPVLRLFPKNEEWRKL